MYSRGESSERVDGDFCVRELAGINCAGASLNGRADNCSVVAAV